MLPRELLREVARIEIRTRSLVDTIYAGGYRSVFKGQGLEFAGIRQYCRGDDFRSIDWKVTARSGNLAVREHMEERELNVVLALDLSRSMAFGSGTREKRETVAEFAAAIALAAARNHDRVGLCLFTDRVEMYVPPRKGPSHLQRVIRELLFRVPAGTGSDLRPALADLGRLVKHRAVVFLISDFIDLPDATRELKVLAGHHDLIVVPVLDPREIEIPDVGLIEFEDPETGLEAMFDTSDRAAVEAVLAQRRGAIERLTGLCQRLGIDRLPITAGEPVVKPICRFFGERERRIARGTA